MRVLRKYIFTLICSVLISQSIYVSVSAYTGTLGGWSDTNGPVYLGDTNSIYLNTYNDVGGVKAQMRSSYSFTDRRTRVLGSRLMQSLLLASDSWTGAEMPVYNNTDILHPYGTYGYTEWFDSPYGVYLDYQFSRLKDGQVSRDQMVWDTINYNASINNTSNNAFLATTDRQMGGNAGGLGDAKGASMLLRRGVVNGDIYLSNSGTVEPHVIQTLKNRGKKNIFIQGGFNTFDNTALFNEGFNVVRIGGKDRQKTFDYSNNMPNEVKNPSMKSANVSGGLIIEGIPSWDGRYNTVVNYLTQLRDSRDMNRMGELFNFLLYYQNIGSIEDVRPWSSPVITVGVNDNGWTTYCSIYGTDTYGIYIYNVVAPSYFENPNVYNDAVRVTKADYNAPGSKDYWVRKGNEFTISASSIVNTNLLPWAYAFNEVYMSEGDTHRKIGITNSGTFGYQNGADWVFGGQNLKHQWHWRDGSRNITHNEIGMYANYETDYKVGMYSILQWDQSIWWGGYGTNGDYVRVDGTPPKSDWNPATRLITNNSLYIMQQGIYDTGSGLVANGDNRPWAYVYKDGSSDRGSWFYLDKDPTWFDYSRTIDLSAHLGNQYGDIRVDIYAMDNVGNAGIVKSYTINRPDPTPTTESVTILDYEYEDSTTKWIKADNEFYIDQRGYHSSIFPTQSNIRISSNTDYNNPSVSSAYAMTTYDYGMWSTNNTNIIKNRDTRLSLWDYNSNHYGQGLFYFKVNPNLNGKKYFVYGFSEITKEGVTREGKAVRDPKMLGIDAVGPRITGTDNNGTYGWTNVDVIINQSVTDNESGMDKVKLYDFTETMMLKSGINSLGYLVSTDGISKYKLYTYDKVGNVTIKNITVNIDKILPSGIFTPNSAAWTKDNVTVSFNPSDNLSGVKQWRYRISSDDGATYGEWSSYIIGDVTSDILISNEGTSKIQAEVIDNATNVGTVTSGSYKIDKTAPTAISYDVVDRQDDTFTIDIKGVTDNGGSGVKSQSVKVWVDTPSGRKEKLYTPLPINGSDSRVVVNRIDFGGVTKTYYYELTLVDNVNNSRTYSSKTGTMIQNNLTANRVDIYDPREKRYVSQTIKGLEYYLVFEVTNNSERQISKEFSINYKIDGEPIAIEKVTDGIGKGETKDYKVKFVAGEENLKGVYYSAIVDCNNNIYEFNEDDNFSSSDIPYKEDRTDEKPPIIPTDVEPNGKIIEPVPIINIDLDLEAYSIETYDMNDKIINELVSGDSIKVKYEIKNNSNLALRYIDIAKKEFSNRLTYKGNVIDTFILNDLSSKEIYLREFTYIVPQLDEGISEEIISLKSEVDYTNNIWESNENNNIKIKNKKALSLKLINYRITKMVNPIKTFEYPIMYDKFPVIVNAGYNVYFNIDAIGNPSSVYAKISDSNGYDYGIHQLTKVKDIDNNTSEWEYVFYPKLDTENNTFIITEVIAAKGNSSYNFNVKNNWDGRTLRIGGNALEDIIIYRRY